MTRIITLAGILLIFLLPSRHLSAQTSLTREEEESITLSGMYYSEYGTGENYETAKREAIVALQDMIVGYALVSSISDSEILRAVEMRANCAKVESYGNICALAWIHRDSIVVTASKPLVRSVVTETQSGGQNYSIPDNLMSCKNISEFRRALNYSGCIFSDINSTDGFSDTGKCHVAVFGPDGGLMLILSPGKNSRTDILSGEVLDDFEKFLKSPDYDFWYFLTID